MLNNISKYLDGFVQALGKTLNFNAYKKVFALTLIENIVYLITAILFTAFFLVTLLIIFANTKFPQNSIEWNSFFLNNIFGIFILFLIILVGIFVLFSIGLYFISANYRLAESILSGKLIKVKEALSKAKIGYFSALKTNILWGIISTTLVILILSPSIYLILNLIINNPNLLSNPLQIILSIGITIITIFVLIIVLLLLSPFVILLTPIALFENKGAIFSLKESFSRAKNNYLSKLIYSILIGFISGTIGTINYSITYPINFSSDLIQPISEFISGFSIFGAIYVFVFYVFYFIILTLIGLIFTSAITLVSSVLVVKYYELSSKTKENKQKKVK